MTDGKSDKSRILDTGTPFLLCEIRRNVAIITLNRPEARNALGDMVTPNLRTIIAQCEADPDVGAFLMTGAGKSFCAGGDIKSLGKPMPGVERTTEESIADLKQKQRTLTAVLVASRKPSVAALPGPAAGAGLSLALACDLRIAARSAFIRTAYVRVGIPGDYGISWLLTRTVGPARARELLLLSEDVTAEQCERIGLVNRVTDDEALFDTAFGIASRLAAGPRHTLGLMKDNLDDAQKLDFLTSLDREAERMYSKPEPKA